MERLDTGQFSDNCPGFLLKYSIYLLINDKYILTYNNVLVIIIMKIRI